MGAPATSPEAIPGCAAATLGGRTHIQLVGAKQTTGEGVRAAVRDERGDDLRDNDAPDGAPTGACVTLLRQLLAVARLMEEATEGYMDLLLADRVRILMTNGLEREVSGTRGRIHGPGCDW